MSRTVVVGVVNDAKVPRGFVEWKKDVIKKDLWMIA
jgi:hypothetical protein